MMNLIVIYRCKQKNSFQKQLFVAGNISCPTIKEQDKLSLQIKRAKANDKIFIRSKTDASKLIKSFKMKDFYPIKKYFEIEGYEIGEEEINDIKNALGGADAIWVNFPESQV